MTSPIARITTALMLAGAFAGCASPTVALQIGFPSEQAFIATSSLDVQVIPLSGSRDQCATLLGAAIQGTTDIHASITAVGLTPCQARAGTTLPDPGGGAQAFIVVGRATNGVILGGCSVGEAYPGGRAIAVDLFPTSTTSYMQAVTAAHIPPGATAAQHCQGSAP